MAIRYGVKSGHKVLNIIGPYSFTAGEKSNAINIRCTISNDSIVFSAGNSYHANPAYVWFESDDYFDLTNYNALLYDGNAAACELKDENGNSTTLKMPQKGKSYCDIADFKGKYKLRFRVWIAATGNYNFVKYTYTTLQLV